MKIFKIPSELKAIIFDIDSTLYTNAEYAFEQIDCQVREFAKLRGLSPQEGRKMVADYRAKFAAENDGKKISLGNTLKAFGIPIEQSVEWRNKLMFPENYLKKDAEIYAELKILSEKYKLICVTNNPVYPARKTLDAIGISEFFPEIVGLDTCFKSKPAPEPFLLAAEKCGCKPENCLAIGDRYDLDIALPMELGMGGILVNGVEDLYGLNEKIGSVSKARGVTGCPR